LNFYKSESYIHKIGILLHYNTFLQIYLILFTVLVVFLILFVLFNQNVKYKIKRFLLKRDYDNEDELDIEKKRKEKSDIDSIKANYIPDAKPIFITIKDHKIEDFINELEKAVF